MSSEPEIKKYKGVTPRHLKDIGALVADWLRGYGGMPDGYETYVKGEVDIDITSRLEINVPSTIMDKMTGGHVKELGRELYTLVQAYLLKHSLDSAVTFEARHMEHGCFEMLVSCKLSYSFRVSD